jgi:rhodanese-related sulfurtransferase
MRKHLPWLALSLPALAMLWTLAPRAASTADLAFKTIAPKDAAARADFVVIDVREPFELAEELGTIEGARNIPLGKVLAGIGLEQGLGKDQPILIVCRTGARSNQAAAKAVAMGFTHVYSLQGGMIAWNESGLKTVKAKAESKQPSLQLNMIGIPCA